MKKYLAILLAAWLAFIPTMAFAAVGTIFVDAGGSATNSGTTDNNSSVINGTAASWTTGTTAITLDTNTNFATVPGCSAGTCDGSQAIFLGNSTNTNQNIFWFTAYSGCTGSGACSITTTASVSCATCSANSWAIGGRYFYPGTTGHDVVVAALRAGDTLQFNNTPASKSTVGYITTTSASGDGTNGTINVIGKTGLRPVLQQTGNTFTISTANGGWKISNLELQGNSASSIVNANGALFLDNVKIDGTGASATQHGIVINSGAVVTNSEIGPVGGDGVKSAVNANFYIINSYIHSAGLDCVTDALVNTPAVAVIQGNVIANCAGRGIFLSGSPSFLGAYTNILNNTIYGNGNSGVEVASSNHMVFLRNNIIQSTITGVATAKWTSGTAQLIANHGYNVFWNSVDTNSGVSGLTLNATEFGADPKLVNAGAANFAIQDTSPAAGVGYFGAAPVGSGLFAGFLDIGALQRQVTAGVATGMIRPGIGQ